MDRYTVPKVDSNWSQLPSTIYENLTSHNNNTWSNTIYNILWYTGIAIATLGVGFLAYSIYTDPGIITKHIPFRSHGNAPVDNGGDVPDIQINDNRTNPSAQAGSWFFNVTSGIYNTYRGALNIFNPFCPLSFFLLI